MTQEILEKLQAQGLIRYDEVLTKEGKHFGKAFAIHHRPSEDVHPKEKQYAHYLETLTMEMGNSSYVPLDFIDHYDAKKGFVHLSVDIEYILRQTWGRTPNFIVGELGTVDELPLGNKTLI